MSKAKGIEARLMEVLKEFEFVEKASKRGNLHYELSEPIVIGDKKIFISVYPLQESKSEKKKVKLTW